MNPATDSSSPRQAIADALAIQLRALTLDVPDPNNPGQNLPAFQNLQIFDFMSLTEAFRYLIISEQRVAVVIFTGMHFEEKLTSSMLFSKCIEKVSILVSDRRLGDRIKALQGDPNDNTVPGAWALAKLTCAAVTGQLITGSEGLSNVVSRPAGMVEVFLKDDDRQELPGRSAIALDLQIDNGNLQADLGPGPTL